MGKKNLFLDQLMKDRRRWQTQFSVEYSTEFYKPKGRLRPRESNQNPIGHRKDIKVGIEQKLS